MIIRLILGIGLVLLAGCSTPPVAAPGQPPPPTVQAVPPERFVPTHIRIGDLGVESTLIPLGLEADGSHEVPSVRTPKQAGWFAEGPEPGEPGASIILGHIDGSGQRGIFWNLDRLVPDDIVEIVLDSGRILRFAVTVMERVDKDKFPADKVYGPTDKPELRLITCGGAFDRASGHYTENVIVYAELIG